MKLATYELPACVKKHGEQAGIAVTAGKHLVIETSPDGGEILDAAVPAGKVWTATISVSIDETDAP